MPERFETHVFSYHHDGRHWELTIRAKDADDARARIAKLAYATYDGVQMARVPVVLAPVGIISVWVRNAVFRLMALLKGLGESAQKQYRQ